MAQTYEDTEISRLMEESKTAIAGTSMPQTQESEVPDNTVAEQKKEEKSSFVEFANNLVKFGDDIDGIMKALKAGVDIYNNRDAYVKKLLDFKNVAEGFNDKLDDALTKAGLDPRITDAIQGKVSSFANNLSSAAYGLYKTADSFLSNAAQQILTWIQGQVFLSEDSLIWLIDNYLKTVPQANPRYDNDYIRRLAITRDLPKLLAWFDTKYKISYSSNRKESVREALLAAESGAFHSATYILEFFDKERKSIEKLPARDDETVAYYAEQAALVTATMAKIVKTIIISSFGNLTVQEVKNIFTKFGFTPKQFNAVAQAYPEASITKADLDIVAPIMILAKTTPEQIFNPSGESEKFIVVRNRNIKKIYLYCTNRIDYPSDYLEHPALHERLKLKMSTTLDISANAGVAAFNANFPLNGLKSMKNAIEGSLVTMIRKSESLIFDPKKQVALSFTEDNIVVTNTPPPSLTPDTSDSLYGPPKDPPQPTDATIVYKTLEVLVQEDSSFFDKAFSVAGSGIYKFKYWVPLDEVILGVSSVKNYWIFSETELGLEEQKYALAYWVLVKMKVLPLDAAIRFPTLTTYFTFFSSYLTYLASLTTPTFGTIEPPPSVPSTTFEKLLADVVAYQNAVDFDIEDPKTQELVYRESRGLSTGVTLVFPTWIYKKELVVVP